MADSYQSQDFKELKQRLQVGDDVQAQLDRLEVMIRKQFKHHHRGLLIPETSLAKIRRNGGKLPEKVARKVHKRGIIIVRDTIPKDLVHEWMAEVVRYLYANHGFPKNKTSQCCDIYWSKAQIAARQHDNIVIVEKV